MLRDFLGGWMRFRTVRSGRTTLCLWAVVCASIAFCAQISAAQATLVIRGAKVYPISGPPIEHGVLLVANGKILAVGEEGKIKIPRGATVEDAGGKVVIPGIVDSHSHIGIIANPLAEDSDDANESSGPIQPGLRALDAIDPADPNIRMATAGGVTAANIMPGSGNVMGGQTAYVKLRGSTIEQMLIPGTIGGMKMANGTNPKGYGTRGQAPMTRMEEAALARGIYEKAQQYKAEWDSYTKAAPPGDKTPTAPDPHPG